MLTGVLFVIAVSTDGWMSRKKVVWIEKVTLLSHKSSETPVIRNNIATTQMRLEKVIPRETSLGE